MVDKITIAPAFQDKVVDVVAKRLGMPREQAEQLVADGVSENELAQFRDHMRVFPSEANMKVKNHVNLEHARKFAKEPTAFTDKWFASEADMDADWYNDLYDAFSDAAEKDESASDEVIDSQREVRALDKLLNKEVRAKKREAMSQLKGGSVVDGDVEDLLEGALSTDAVTVRELPGDIIHAMIELEGDRTVPIDMGPLRRLFTNKDVMVERLPKLADKLYASLALMDIKPKGGGFVTRATLHATMVPDPSSYVHITFTNSGNRVVIKMRSLSLAEEKEYQLPALPSPRVESLNGKLTFTSRGPGKTEVVFDVKVNPGLTAIPDALIKSDTLGVPGQLTAALLKIGTHLIAEATVR